MNQYERKYLVIELGEKKRKQKSRKSTRSEAFYYFSESGSLANLGINSWSIVF
jgi:hypothetical protein